MTRDTFLNNLRGKTIKDFEFEEVDSKMVIKKIITDDGYHYDIENEEFFDPIYEAEKANFQERLSQMGAGSVFEFRAEKMTLDEMRQLAYDHSKKINANGGNVTPLRSGSYLVRMGEDLDELRRGR